MKAVITGTPLQIEGEPAEIAQLVDLLSSGAVMVEHVHHWRLGLPDDDGIQQGACWCGTTKAFAPFGENGSGLGSGKASPTMLAKLGKVRTCKRCGGEGHDVRKCPQPAEAAA